jgi:DNA-binding cell septation regulator SpoVG
MFLKNEKVPTVSEPSTFQKPHTNTSNNPSLASPEPSEQFIAFNWRALEKNTLRGFVSLELPSGLIIHECSVHSRDGKTWVAMPAREYKKDGESKWRAVIDFSDKETGKAFQKRALQAVDEMLEAGGE